MSKTNETVWLQPTGELEGYYLGVLTILVLEHVIELALNYQHEIFFWPATVSYNVSYILTSYIFNVLKAQGGKRAWFNDGEFDKHIIWLGRTRGEYEFARFRYDEQRFWSSSSWACLGETGIYSIGLNDKV